MPELAEDGDSIAKHFQVRRDEAIRRINIRFKLAVFGLIVMGIISISVKKFIHIDVILLMLIAAWVIQAIKTMQISMDNLRSELRYRSVATDQKVVDVHTSVAYIYAQKLGLLHSSENFDPLVFLWDAKRALESEKDT
jgi:hypothetical protein